MYLYTAVLVYRSALTRYSTDTNRYLLIHCVVIPTILCFSLWSPKIVVVIHNSQLCSSPHAVISEVKPLLCIFQNYGMVNLQWSCFNDNHTHTDHDLIIKVNLEYFDKEKSVVESVVWLHEYKDTTLINNTTLVTRWCRLGDAFNNDYFLVLQCSDSTISDIDNGLKNNNVCKYIPVCLNRHICLKSRRRFLSITNPVNTWKAGESVRIFPPLLLHC